MTARGKLIVFEGGDGSGKATQTQLLTELLGKKGVNHFVVDFPRYGQSLGAGLVAKYLRGEFGELDRVPPEFSSLGFAIDRFEMRGVLESLISKSWLVLANRYVGSNLAHQAARLPQNLRGEFVNWLKKLEYQVFGIPKEDLVIFLHTPAVIGQRLVGVKAEREYLQGQKMDIHEKDLAYLREVEQQFLLLCETQRWEKIECVVDGKLRTAENISQEVVDILQERGILL